MVPALRIRRAKPVNERRVNTSFGREFDSRRLHSIPSELYRKRTTQDQNLGGLLFEGFKEDSLTESEVGFN